MCAPQKVVPMQQPYQSQQLSCWSCKQVGHEGQDCPNILCYWCWRTGHIASNCSSPKEECLIDCFLCKTLHEKGSCPQAGKLTSALARCSVCTAYCRSINKQPTLTTHLFTKSGNVERDMCPVIVGVTQPSRSKFLRSHNVCTVCLTGRSNTLNQCPDSEKLRTKFLCSELSCHNRRGLCPNPSQHIGLTSDQIEPRMNRAIDAGMPVTLLNVAIKTGEQIEKLR